MSWLGATNRSISPIGSSASGLAAIVEGLDTALGIGGNGAAQWQTLKVGSGGFVRGISIAADGTMVAHTDTNGAYLYNGTNWQQLFNVNSLPSSLLNSTDLQIIGDGCFEIQIAPTNTQIFYAAYIGYVFVSSNQGTTWTQTNFTRNAAGMPANDNTGYAQNGPRIAIDPHNANIVFVGTENSGVSYTTNGGTSWTQISSSALPYGTGAGITGLLFYANGTVTGGVTQTIYAAVWGTGVYVSNNAGSTWTLTSSGPTNVTTAAIDSSGNYYAVSGESVYKYSGGTWTTLYTDSGGTPQAVAVNPFNINEVAVVRSSGWINISYNGGTTFNAGTGPNYSTTVVSTDIPWLVQANGSGGNLFLDVGQCAWSPITNGKLICSAGTGTFYATIPTSGFNAGTAISWNDFSAGIEQLVANDIVIPPISGSNAIIASWDRPFFAITNPASYPSTYGPVASTNITMGWGLDYASSNPQYVFGWSTWNGSNISGYTTNYGASWAAFSSEYTTTSYGSIAASSPTNIIVSPGSGGTQPGYTTNGGSSWTGITLPGVSSWSGYGGLKRSVAADRVNANTFYLYYPGNGVYVSTNSGVTWTQQKSGLIEANSGEAAFRSSLRSVPGNAGHLFYTSGIQAGMTFNTPSGGTGTAYFYRSTNGGVSWSVVSNVLGVLDFNFGAVANGYSYPSIYIVGFVGGVFGCWQSLDNATTWTNLGNPFSAGSSLQYIVSVATDPNNFGYVYVGTDGGGYVYYNG